MTTMTDDRRVRAAVASPARYFYFHMALACAAVVGQTDAGIAFSIVRLSGILFFAVVFTLGVAAVRQPETHKRLMLLAGISILDAAVARWFLTFLAPPGPPGPPPVAVAIPP